VELSDTCCEDRIMKNVASLLGVGVLAWMARADALTTFPPTQSAPLDPKVKAALEALPQAKPIEELTPAEARAFFEKITAQDPKLNEAVAKVENRTIPGPGGKITVRIYTPEGKGPFPMLLYLHGGGWVLGTLDIYDDLCRSLCHRAGAVVVSVNYRLAPEHPFPAPLEDCTAALSWCADHGADVGGDSKRLAVAGDSAGGNLSACVALHARDKGGPKIALQVLIYPVTNYGFDTMSYHQCAEGYLLTREAMVYFWKHYILKAEDASSPYASPLRAKDLKGLPPALVLTAQYDVLRDDGEAYAVRLQRAGVPVHCTRYLGLIHGFIRYGAVFDQTKHALDEIAEALRKAYE
jgi:acetyl esterase